MNGAWKEFIKTIGAPLALVAIVAGINLHVRVATIEANRFTDQDGFAMESRLKVWVEERYPPMTLLEDISELKILTKNQDVRLDAIDIALSRILTKLEE